MKKHLLQISFYCLLLPLTLFSKTPNLNQEVTLTKSTFSQQNEAIPFLWHSAKHEALKGDSFHFFRTQKSDEIPSPKKEKIGYTQKILKYLFSKMKQKIKRYKQM